ncbi:hypothetical protein RSOLAG22IIIB_07127 [Rhizoctonia solani]|uniref:GH16 domain-containing protein n=1 Tax=Rhizoctonia solani TaxID=456999 RepID=A0A0K6GIU4_9AGAM|nr:hypothetical protein RSOLAG22IIIB_07127 [Rhizoctonia solani]
MVRSLLLAPLAVAAASAATLTERQSTCACGYKDSTGAVWVRTLPMILHRILTSVLAQNYYKFTWQEDHENVPYGMQYTANNVYAYNDGLGIKTSAFSGSGRVQTGGIGTTRSDILYGTFRMRATVPKVPGVCFGFFTYQSDTQEADIEFLSSDTDYYQRVHQTNQPGLINGNTDLNAYKEVVIAGADFTAFHEHRLDWIPGSTKYYFDGSLKSTVSKNSPTVASSILANVWSDGGSGWTKGPPTQDAIANIYYIKVNPILL